MTESPRFARLAALLAAGIIIVAAADGVKGPKPVDNSQGPSCKGANCYKAPIGPNKRPCKPGPPYHRPCTPY